MVKIRTNKDELLTLSVFRRNDIGNGGTTNGESLEFLPQQWRGIGAARLVSRLHSFEMFRNT